MFPTCPLLAFSTFQLFTFPPFQRLRLTLLLPSHSRRFWFPAKPNSAKPEPLVESELQSVPKSVDVFLNPTKEVRVRGRALPQNCHQSESRFETEYISVLKPDPVWGSESESKSVPNSEPKPKPKSQLAGTPSCLEYGITPRRKSLCSEEQKPVKIPSGPGCGKLFSGSKPGGGGETRKAFFLQTGRKAAALLFGFAGAATGTAAFGGVETVGAEGSPPTVEDSAAALLKAQASVFILISMCAEIPAWFLCACQRPCWWDCVSLFGVRWKQASL